MASLPGPIRRTLENLKKGYQPPSYLVLRRINGKYYVYKDQRPWDSDKKKRKTVSEYLGRITEDGTFIRKEITEDDRLANAKAIIAAYGGKVIIPEKKGPQEEPQKLLTSDQIDLRILTILSMNARSTLPFMAKRIGLSISAVENRVRQLERRYQLECIPEIDTEKLGYLKFLIFVKFIDNIPSRNDMERIMKSESRVQLAMFLNGGDYNLIIYVLVETNEEVSHLARKLMLNESIRKYSAEWYTTPFYETYDFVPLREDFIDSLKGKLARRKDLFEEKTSKKTTELLKREFAILKELNNNAKTEFTEIDKKYGFDKGRAQYSYHKLIERGLLKRTTVSLRKLPIKYIEVLYVKIINPDEFYRTRTHLLASIIEKTNEPLNNYTLAGDMGMPNGVLLFIPVYDMNRTNEIKEELIKSKGSIIQSAIVTDILIGKLCYRKFDTSYSIQYKVLIDQYGMKPSQREDYPI